MNTEKFEKSCGAITFTREGGEIKYLLAEEMHGAISFPKGHVEGNETEEETAIREIREETNLTPSFIDGFKRVQEFPLLDSPGTTKQVVYFLFDYTGQTPKIVRPYEVRSLKSLPLQEALNTIQFQNMRDVLVEADDFIKKL
jgi:8-oxo-dGTP pyrophosphatase MutT (NUDIX family)